MNGVPRCRWQECVCLRRAWCNSQILCLKINDFQGFLAKLANASSNPTSPPVVFARWRRAPLWCGLRCCSRTIVVIKAAANPWCSPFLMEGVRNPAVRRLALRSITQRLLVRGSSDLKGRRRACARASTHAGGVRRRE